MLSYREPRWFVSEDLCFGWAAVWGSLLEASLLLTLVLSVSRTIVIARPFVRIKRKHIAIVLCVWLVWKVTKTGLFYLTSHYIIQFTSSTCYCVFVPNITLSTNIGAWEMLPNLSYIIPCFLVLFSFIISVVCLARNNIGGTATNQRASITIATLTGLFLATTTPFMVIDIYYLVDMVAGTYPAPHFMGIFMYWYSWPLTRAVLPCINAALNPVIYLLKVPNYTKWVAGHLLKRAGGSNNTQTINHGGTNRSYSHQGSHRHGSNQTPEAVL